MQPRDGGEVGPRRLLHGVLMVIVCDKNILLLYDVVEKSLLMVEDCGHGLENIYWPLGCGDRRLLGFGFGSGFGSVAANIDIFTYYRKHVIFSCNFK